MAGMTLAVPSGVGDQSWICSRIWSVRDEIDTIEMADGWPQRSHQYFELLPWKSCYGEHRYELIVAFEQVNELGMTPRWEQVRAIKESARIFIEANRHLEAGLPLAGWLPDIPAEETYFHYPLMTTEAHVARAVKLMAPAVAVGKPLVGISCASYRGSEAWKTWGRPEWTVIISRILAEGWHPVLLGGYWDDLTSAVADTFEDRVTVLVGKTHFGEVTEILRRLDAYVGFSSGLNVIRTVLNKPAMALWPDHQEALSRSWAPPHMQEWESGRYVARLWRPPDEVWPTMRKFLKTCGDEIGKTLAPPCK